MAVISSRPTAGSFLSLTQGNAIKKLPVTLNEETEKNPPDKSGSNPTIDHKRKTPSTQLSSNSSTPAMNKKRARLSIGTPGKVTPLNDVREREVERTFTELEVTEVYKAIRKKTGSLGGNAAGGAIYGEITQASFQRVVDYLKDNCELTKNSRFIDVGSGLGKPNFHVAMDPGVQVSYGIELEELRWHLSLHNLRSILLLDSQRVKPLATVFTAGDITHAQTFEPFSHVYSFDVGFPPDVMDKMADMFNRSSAKYYTSFHAPRKIVEMYGFSVENIGRVATSMAGSSEGHQCYFYRRLTSTILKKELISEKLKVEELPVDNTSLAVDPLFTMGLELLKGGREGMIAWLTDFFGHANEGRTRRQKRELRERRIDTYYPSVKANVLVPSKGLAQKSNKKTPKITRRKICLQV
ncbi:hypothetical protein CCR75_006894 [Bremia lactucae]|uniref:DOT1 domain-containing protein n=1 Tax=Bremia lactucae TaxID=4779 RepID=A0A976FFF7_BRELC|nr:hypothetical protein CCR75_006894 [Bremia lactucae]